MSIKILNDGENVRAVRINDQEIYVGCWHNYKCSLYTSHNGSRQLSINEYDPEKTLKNIDANQPFEERDTIQRCICDKPELWHYHCCEKATFCPECNASTRTSNMCEWCYNGKPESKMTYNTPPVDPWDDLTVRFNILRQEYPKSKIRIPNFKSETFKEALARYEALVHQTFPTEKQKALMEIEERLDLLRRCFPDFIPTMKLERTQENLQKKLVLCLILYETYRTNEQKLVDKMWDALMVSKIYSLTEELTTFE